jgi:type IV pilus assembly protein PilE
MTVRTPRSAQAGVTLIELLVAVAIVALRAAIAMPAYSSFVRSSNRSDAKRTLMQDAEALQRCYSQTYTYAGCTTVATTSANGYYSIAYTAPNAAANPPTPYYLTATPIKSPQTSDTQCAQFILSGNSQQSATDSGGNDTTQTCWGGN